MLSNGLEINLEKFLAPFMGDWPTQFFMQQFFCNSLDFSLPSICQNVVPLSLVQLTKFKGVCVKVFPPYLCQAVFRSLGKKAKLTKKPKAWRVSLLLEVLYGGLTLICESILSVFCFC